MLLHPETDIAELRDALHPELYMSVGVHPWYAAEWTMENIPLLDSMLSPSCFSLLGEIGLDNACDTPFSVQVQVFEKQLQIADKEQIPVLIHNVGHQEVLLALKKKYGRIPTWILHGFRGKVQEARQFLDHGFHLSFGLKFHVESLRFCPLDRLFLETDNSSVDLKELYAIVAKEKSISLERLEQSLHHNFNSIVRK